MPSRSLTTVSLKVLLLVTFAGNIFHSQAIADDSVKVRRITPSGENVPAANQILITFNKKLVPLGDMRRSRGEVPITIKPALNCQWQWLTPSALACQLNQEDALKLATKYTIVINRGALNQEGESLDKSYSHTIKTALPQVTQSGFSEIKQRGKPVYNLHFNQNVSKRSVARTVKFQYQVNGKTKQVAAKVTKFLPSRDMSADDEKVERSTRQARYWFVQPKKILPKDSAVEIVVLPGLSTSHGNMRSLKSEIVKWFHTFDDFKFTGISCSNTAFKQLNYTLDELDRAKCNPRAPVNLNFSTPVNSHALYEQLGLWRNGDLSDYLKDAWKANNRWARIYSAHTKGQSYPVPLPTILLPDERIEVRALDTLENAKPITDMLGQTLVNSISASFKTRHYTPEFKLPYSNVVLEKGLDSDGAIIVTNIESIDFNYQLSNGTKGQRRTELDFGKNQTASMQAGIREILGDKSGAVFGTFSSNSLNPKPRIFAQITPYQVHAKIGHYSSLVWVSDLATGELINNAKVEVIRADRNIPAVDSIVLDTAQTNQLGIAKLKGLDQLDPEQDITNYCGHEYCKRMFIRVAYGEDSALLPIDRHYETNVSQISDGQIYRYQRGKFGHLAAWGTSAQGIYRPGDTIDYKIYLRDQNDDGLIPAPKESYELLVEDPNGNPVYELEDLKLNDHGSLSGKINLSSTATMGWYRFILSSSFSDNEMYPLEVLVTDFTPAPFKLTQKVNGSLFEPGQELVVDIDARLHSGGPYANTQAELEIVAIPSSFKPDTPIASGFNFDNYDNYYNQDLLTKTLTVDGQGHASASIILPNLNQGQASAEIIAQSMVEDERGKAVVSRSKVDYLGVDRLVGLKSSKWVYESGKPATLESLVVDKTGKPIAGTKVDVRIYQYGAEHHKKLASEEPDLVEHPDGWGQIASCETTSSSQESKCSFTPDSAGTYRFSASIEDTQGRPHNVFQDIWVSGRGSVFWNQDSPYSLELVSEKASFEVGETARYLVKNPYPGATALITIERYGVLESWQQTLEGSAPLIEFEVDSKYAPGVYLSVLVVKPRTGNETPKYGEVDSNQPSYKIGYQKIEVNDPERALEVEIKTDLKVYKPGDTVTLTLKPKQFAQDIELAISVLDEAVLDLVKKGSEYFDPYQGFYKLDSLDVGNYNILNHLVGLQAFSEPKTDDEVKAMLSNQTDGVIFHAPSVRVLRSELSSFASSGVGLEEIVVTAQKRVAPGEDDEPKEIRARDNLVDSAHWQDSVKVNKDGTVTIRFKLPDNLTGWRVLALATTPSDGMGLSQHSFKVNQLTEIRPVMPNQLTETDDFNAGFSVLNRSEQTRTIKVAIKASGNASTNSATFERTLELAAHARETVLVPMVANRLKEGMDHGSIDYLITAGDSLDTDALKHSLRINKRKNLSTAAVYGSTIGDNVIENILIPNNVASDLGGVSVNMSPTIISNVGGAFEYMRRFPYTCWEQKLTKAVMASHYKTLGHYFSDELEWPESQNLTQETLEKAINSQAPNGGMTYFRAENNYVSPYLSAYTALAFTWMKDAGYTIPIVVQENLHAYLNTIINEENELNRMSPSAISTVQAVALAALAKNGDLSRRSLLLHFSKSQEMSLFGKAQMLDALKQFENTEAQQQSLIDQILAHSDSSAGKIVFNETVDTSYARIHSSSMRSNCAILDTFSTAETLIADQDLPSNLVQTIVAKRGGRRHWENTQDNVYCMNALSRYASVYESEKPAFRGSVTLGDDLLGSANFSSFDEPTKKVSLPMRADLIGTPKKLSIKREGVGRLYYQTLLQFSKVGEQNQRENAGMDIRRERSVFRDDRWQLLKAGDQIHRGETVRTDLFFAAPAARNFVAVRDPVPGGLEPINSDLANNGQSLKIAQLKQATSGSYYFERDSWRGFSYSPWGFYHKELGHDAVTFYSDYVEKGEYHLSYLSQAIATGEFVQQAVHAEEMYHPDVYGKGRTGTLRIVE